MSEDDILPEVSGAVEHVGNALSFQFGVIYLSVLPHLSFGAWASNNAIFGSKDER